MSQSVYSQTSKVELWGGIECTINRVGDQYRDQLSETGHYVRSDDIDLISTLNLKAFRYPIIWERHEVKQGQIIDWSFAANGLWKLKSAGIKPIVGLLHHGSGPAFTNLLDEAFPEKFAAYAAQVAETFPDVEYYSLINEPLTTARFSGLYGFWFPHEKDPKQFALMLLNQCKAITLGMHAIRKTNPAAKLVQTEDLAKCHATNELQYQANFENERRWLSFDLLCGRVNEQHSLWNYFISIGISASSLSFFLDNPCPPDMMGMNYYVTSERFLDQDYAKYPNVEIGGNGTHQYVDVEAVRRDMCVGIEVLLEEAWDRYHIPLAITEVHLACSREEQMRWFKEIWDSCVRASTKVDLRAITAWSIFGAYDWDSLATKRNGHYEPGAFDVSGSVRETALASMIRAIGEFGDYQHPLLEQQGWWHGELIDEKSDATLLVVGDTGALSAGLLKICKERRILIQELTSSVVDLENLFELLWFISTIKPWGIISTIQSNSDHRADSIDEGGVHQALVSKNIATAAFINKIPFMTFLLGHDEAGPSRSQNYHLRNLAQHNEFSLSHVFNEEQLVAAANPDALLIRTSITFSPWEPSDFTFKIITALKHNLPLQVPINIEISPTYLPHLLHYALDLFIDKQSGTWLLAQDTPKLSWSDFATELARRGGYKADKLEPIVAVDESKRNDKFSRDHNTRFKAVRMQKLGDAIDQYLLQLNE